MPTLRVMTYNIFRGGRYGPPLHEVVRRAAPDVLVVNETPKSVVVWHWQCRRLSRLWGMAYVAGGRRAGSNMLLVSSAARVLRSESRRIHQPRFQPRRGIVSAQLEARGHLFGVVGCHLSLDAQRRTLEVEQVIDAARGLEGPVVVAGDLNESPDGPCWRRLREEGYLDHGDDTWLTFPAASPCRRIDALLVRGNARVSAHGSPAVAEEWLSRGSDHRPVLADLEL